MKAFLSILGLWNYDDTIFANFNVPTGLDRDVAINKILFDCAELGLVYTDPDIVKVLIKNWSDTNSENWAKIYAALIEQYDPLHNYDKHEEWTDDRTIANDSTSTDNGHNEHDVAGFNDNQILVHDYKDTLYNQNVIDHDGTDNLDHLGHIYGNIGVKTSQSMLTEEVELRTAYNMYQIITNSFKKTFCVMVY